MIVDTRRLANRWRNVPSPRGSAWRRLTTAQLFVASFALLIVIGTVALRTLPMLYVGERLGWLDALFTATSAVCVTGLTVLDTGTSFSFAGQAVLLLLIQLGGLGMIAFTTIIILALGRRPSLRQEHVYAQAVEVAPHVDRDRLVRNVVRFTLAFEMVGALILYALWVPRFGWRGAMWPALFHAVSAFCNAGFSLFADSLAQFQLSPLTLVVVMVLVVAGGMGFLTLQELHQWWVERRRRAIRLSVHSRLVLVATVTLLAGGWLLFAALEWSGVLRDLPVSAKLTNALFLSVTPRTAGFATIDYARAADSTTFLTIMLMFVGGSPGSTAGGLKTTTVALLALLAVARLRGRVTPSAWARSIPEETIQRAVGLAVTAFALVTAGIFILTVSERHGGVAANGTGFLGHMFEAVSAFNTVGLTVGVTPELSPGGRVLMILLMFVGRVGPLTFAAALAMAARRRRDRFHFAYEDVIVG